MSREAGRKFFRLTRADPDEASPSMLRAIIEEALLFLVPFGLFALYLILRRRNPLLWAHWDKQASWLVIAGLVFAVAALVYAGLTAERHKGAFVPPHLENGRVVPGQFR